MGILEVAILNLIFRTFAFGILFTGFIQASTPSFAARKHQYISYNYESDAKGGLIEIRIQLAPNDDGYVVYKLLPTSMKPLGPLNIHGRTILDEDDLRIMIMLHLQAGGKGLVAEGESSTEEIDRKVNEIVAKVRKLRADSFGSGKEKSAVPEPSGNYLDSEKPKPVSAPKKMKSASYKKKFKVVKKKTAKIDVNSKYDDVIRFESF
jgi:hypothetical protein